MKPFVARANKKKDEHILQCLANEYLQWALIPGKSEYLGHESSIGLGIMRINSLKDSRITKACKQFYNRFVIAAQKKFQDKGVTKGSSDGFIFYMGGVLCIEFKVKYNKSTPSQKEFAERMAKIGYPTINPKKLDDIKQALIMYNIPNRDMELK